MIGPLIKRFVYGDGDLSEASIGMIHESIRLFSIKLRQPDQSIVAIEDIDFAQYLLLGYAQLSKTLVNMYDLLRCANSSNR